ncbi:hypothetical protein SIID45300_02726 [Candidatus Magnetaquicoccaceae bacterium FCR-1]|uniref:Uncharacterized protein n=2 Tax=Candidatus Magnetaquiglobus chichijimensis TaxID=3141448 RepID=A0ABQ0CBW1_9PROT
MKFMNKENEYTEEVSSLVWLWVLLFGMFYFAVKGVWRHVLISLILSMITLGISWLVYPFFAKGIMRKHYLRMGWVEVPE